jgi:hypothetical protein
MLVGDMGMFLVYSTDRAVTPPIVPALKPWYWDQVQAMMALKATNKPLVPWECHRKPGMGLYHLPDPTTQPYSRAQDGDNGVMDVFDVAIEAPTGPTWLLVWKSAKGDIWVQAAEAAE